MKSVKDEAILFIVFFESARDVSEIVEKLEMVKFSFGLYLVHSTQTQSKLYHSIKHAIKPEVLFVGKLKDDPKFKGMEPGTLKWIRSLK